MQIMLKLYIK